MFMTTFAQRLTESMLEAGVTQQELANHIKVSQAAIQKLTSGKAKSSRKIIEIAKKLQVDAEWLATGLGEKNKLKTETETNTPRKPPVIDEEEWKALPPKARALVEDFLIKSSRGELSESSIKLLQNTVDELSKEK